METLFHLGRNAVYFSSSKHCRFLSNLIEFCIGDRTTSYSRPCRFPGFNIPPKRYAFYFLSFSRSRALIHVAYLTQPWEANISHVLQHIRQYATSKRLNSDDDEYKHVTPYSTRVERVRKLPGSNTWTLTLRKAELVEGRSRLRMDWWTEEFDAVLLASNSQSDCPWIPDILGLKELAERFEESVWHSRQYRRPQQFTGKVCVKQIQRD